MFYSLPLLMRIIAKSTLREFWEKHNDAEVPLKTWHKIVEKQNWQNTHDIKQMYGDASIIGSNRVVFNIKGNNYRLVVYIVFKVQKVFIRFIGTHKQYDNIDVRTI
jgi:mRNA interferase HigB